MSRRNTTNRLILFRECGICGKTFKTTADTPFLRTIKIDGHYKNTYYCTESCWRKSYVYKGWWDGKTLERKAQAEARRDIKAKNKKYYEAHKEQEKARQRAAYWADPEAHRAANAYQRQKRKALEKSL